MSIAEAVSIAKSNAWRGARATFGSNLITVTIPAVAEKCITVGHIRLADQTGTGNPNVSIKSAGVEIYRTIVDDDGTTLAFTVDHSMPAKEIAGLVGEEVIVETASTTITAGYMHVSYKQA